LIEGDNGTGKDTLRGVFERDGWLHVNEAGLPSQLIKGAREETGKARISRYLEYCLACAAVAENAAGKSVCVRYWPSTASAAFADGLITVDELDSLILDCLQQFPLPDCVIELKCDYKARIGRIEKRKLACQGHVDNLELPRGERFEFAMARISERIPVPWLVVDNTKLDAEAQYTLVREWLTNSFGEEI